MDGQYLLTNHILKSLAEKTKEASKQKQEYRHDKEKGEWLCPDHDEKLKLYCITDQQLICVICRDGQRHESHKFKPVNEAATLVRAELDGLVKYISDDTSALEVLVQSQTEEISKTEGRSQELKSLINKQFAKLDKFLKEKKRELNEKVKCDKEDGVKKMTEQLNAMEEAKGENTKLKETVTSVLEIQETEKFLRTWSEEKEAKEARKSFKPKKGNFKVQNAPLSLGPYESHLQMFVWKEMLQVIEPREENMLLQIGQTSLIVSGDQRSLCVCPFQQNSQQHSQYHNQYVWYDDYNQIQSTNTLAGQHYWEVYVGQLNDFELGLPTAFIKIYNSTYQICISGRTTALTVEVTPKTIGLYLNCDKRELSFYNADNMTHIHTVSLASTSFPVSAYFKLGQGSGGHDSMTVCRY